MGQKPVVADLQVGFRTDRQFFPERVYRVLFAV